MVSTRHSLPSAAAAAASSPPDAKAEKALKKLQILGNDALKGDMEAARKKKESQAVYHFRGAVYAVEESTRSEWVENQPKRYQKRVEEDAAAGAAVQESEAEETRPAKRTRKSLPQRMDKAKKAPAKDRRNTMPAKTTRKRKAALAEETNNSRLFDYTTVGGADERVISARLPSWVAPSPEEREAKHGHRWRATAKKNQLRPDHQKLRTEIAEQKATAGKKKYDVAPLSNTSVALTPAQLEEREILNSIIRLAKIRRQLTATHKEFAQARALLELKQSERNHLSPVVTPNRSPQLDTVVTSTAPSQRSGPDNASTMDTDQPEPELDIESSMPPPPPPPRPRRTPATGANASPSAEPEENTLLGSISPLDAPRGTSEAPNSLPERDKNGNPLRWSLYTTASAASTTDGDAGDEVQEWRVNRDRLPAETRQQKRRRVSREVALVKGWARVQGGKVVTEGTVGGRKELGEFGEVE